MTEDYEGYKRAITEQQKGKKELSGLSVDDAIDMSVEKNQSVSNISQNAEVDKRNEYMELSEFGINNLPATYKVNSYGQVVDTENRNLYNYVVRENFHKSEMAERKTIEIPDRGLFGNIASYNKSNKEKSDRNDLVTSAYQSSRGNGSSYEAINKLEKYERNRTIYIPPKDDTAEAAASVIDSLEFMAKSQAAGVAGGVTGSVGGPVGAAIGSTLAMMGTAFKLAKDDAYNELIPTLLEEGVDFDEAGEIASSESTVQGAIEAVLERTLGVGKIGAKLVLKQFAKTGAKTSGLKVGTKSTKELLKKGVKDLPKTIVSEAVSEGITEGLQSGSGERASLRGQGLGIDEATGQILDEISQFITTGETTPIVENMLRGAKLGAIGGAMGGGVFQGGISSVETIRNLNQNRKLNKAHRESTKSATETYDLIKEKESESAAKAFISALSESGQIEKRIFLNKEAKQKIIENAEGNQDIVSGIEATLGLEEGSLLAEDMSEVDFTNYIETKSKFSGILEQNVEDDIAFGESANFSFNDVNAREKYELARIYDKIDKNDKITTEIFNKLEGSKSLTEDQKYIVGSTISKIADIMSQGITTETTANKLFAKKDKGVAVRVLNTLEEEVATKSIGDNTNVKGAKGEVSHPNGAFTVEDYANIISLFDKHNFTTAMHETNHWFWKTMSRSYAEGNLTSEWSSDMDKVYKWLGKKKGDKSLTDKELEKIAFAFESKLLKGESFAIGTEAITQVYQDWFEQVYGSSKRGQQLLDFNIDNDISRILDLQLYSRKQVVSELDVQAMNIVDVSQYKHLEDKKKYLSEAKKLSRNEASIMRKSLDKIIGKGSTISAKEAFEKAEKDYKDKFADSTAYKAREDVIKKKLDRQMVIDMGVNPENYPQFIKKSPKEIKEIIENIPSLEQDPLQGYEPDRIETLREIAELENENIISKADYVLDRIDSGQYIEQSGIDVLKEIKEIVSRKIPKMPEDFIQYVRRTGGINIDVAKGFDLHELPAFKDKKFGANGLFNKKSKRNEKDISELINLFTGEKLDDIQAIDFFAEASETPNYGDSQHIVDDINRTSIEQNLIFSELGLDKNNISQKIKEADNLRTAPSNLRREQGEIFNLEKATRGQSPNTMAAKYNYNTAVEMLEDISSINTINKDANIYANNVKSRKIIADSMQDKDTQAFYVVHNLNRSKQALRDARIYKNETMTGINKDLDKVIQRGDDYFKNELMLKEGFNKTFEKITKFASDDSISANNKVHQGQIDEAVKLKQRQAMYIYVADKLKKENDRMNNVIEISKKYNKDSAIRKYGQKFLFEVRTILNSIGTKGFNTGTYPDTLEGYEQYVDVMTETYKGLDKLGKKRSALALKTSEDFLIRTKDVETISWGDVASINDANEAILGYGKHVQSVKHGEMTKEFKELSESFRDENDKKSFIKRKGKTHHGKDSTYIKAKKGYGAYLSEGFGSAEHVFKKWGDTVLFKLFQPIMKGIEQKTVEIEKAGKEMEAFYKEKGIKNGEFNKVYNIDGHGLTKTNLINLIMYSGRKETKNDVLLNLQDIYGRDFTEEQANEFIQKALDNLNKSDMELINWFFKKGDDIMYKTRKEAAEALQDKVVLKSTAVPIIHEKTGFEITGGYILRRHRDTNKESELANIFNGVGKNIGDGANNEIVQKTPSLLRVDDISFSKSLDDVFTYALILPEAVKMQKFMDINKSYINSKFGEGDVNLAERYLKDLFHIPELKTVLDRFANKLNKAGKIMILGGNPLHVPIQAIGFLASVPQLGAYMVKPMGNYLYNSPKETYNSVLNREHRSEYMRQRATYNKKYFNFSDESTLPFVGGNLSKAKRGANVVFMIYLRMGDRIASTITWDAAYAKAIEEGRKESDAIFYADHMVRTTQGDYASYAREMSPLVKIFLPFTSYFATQMNQFRFFRETKNKQEMLAFLVFVMLISPIMEETIRAIGKGEAEDEDNWPKRLTSGVLETAANTAVVGIGGTFARSMLSDSFYATTHTTPISSTIGEFLKASSNVADIIGIDGETDFDDDEIYWNAMSSYLKSAGVPRHYFSDIEKYILDK